MVGVTTLSALLAALVADDSRRLLAAAIDAKHGQVYFQAISPGGQSIVAPSLVRVRDAARLMGGTASLVGSGAPAVAAEIAGIDIAVTIRSSPRTSPGWRGSALSRIPPTPCQNPSIFAGPTRGRRPALPRR